VEKASLLVQDFTRQGRRYIVVIGDEGSEVQRERRRRLMKIVRKEFEDMNAKYREGLISAEALESEGGLLLADLGLGEHFSPLLIDGYGIALNLNKEGPYLSPISGSVVVLSTDLSPTEFSSSEVIDLYKGLLEIQAVFRSLLNPPGMESEFWSTPDGFKANIIGAMLALWVERLLSRCLGQAGLPLSPQAALHMVRQMKIAETSAGDDSAALSTRLTPTTERLLEAVGFKNLYPS
jgi:hypothetical protein